jgi:hypothetical protein
MVRWIPAQSTLVPESVKHPGARVSTGDPVVVVASV